MKNKYDKYDKWCNFIARVDNLAKILNNDGRNMTR